MAGNEERDNNRQAWYVYIIEASDSSLYTGVTTDVKRRFTEHQGTSRAAKYFRGRQALKIVYTETHQDRSSALRRESAIKQLPRADKLELIKQGTVKSGLGAPVDI